MSTDPTLNCTECQKHSPFLDFHLDGLGFDLPRHHYRCPSCGHQWTMEVVEPARIIPSRFAGESPLIIPALRKRAQPTNRTL